MGQPMATLAVKDVAKLEGVSERQIQRYVKEGFKGHVLPAVRVGKASHIEETDYRAWRVACGWDQPELAQRPVVGSLSPQSPQVEVIAPVPAPCAEQYPPWPQCADPNGELTNAPSEHSRNWPHPRSCEQYMREQRRKQIEQLRGYADETEN
jgi:hypothetical protein